ncbi:MAG: tetratricopeptide repeat protein [Candidatus Brocadiaceae bacterium]
MLGVHSAKIYFYLGKVHSEMDQVEDAIEAYNEAISCNAKPIAPHYSLGKLYLKNDHAEETIEEFTKVTQP